MNLFQNFFRQAPASSPTLAGKIETWIKLHQSEVWGTLAGFKNCKTRRSGEAGPQTSNWCNLIHVSIFPARLGVDAAAWRKKFWKRSIGVCARYDFAGDQRAVWAPDRLAALTIRHRRCMSWHHDVDACHGTMTYHDTRYCQFLSSGTYSLIYIAKYWPVHELLWFSTTW